MTLYVLVLISLTPKVQIPVTHLYPTLFRTRQRCIDYAKAIDNNSSKLKVSSCDCIPLKLLKKDPE